MDRREFLLATAAGSVVALQGALARGEQPAAPTRLPPTSPLPGTVNAAPAGRAPSSTAATVRRTAPDRFVLEFAPREPRPLRILQLTDTHFGNPDLKGKVQDQRSFLTIGRLVERHRPDFIVHTGDFINNDNGPKVSLEAIDVLDDLGLPWTHALGNHDIGARSVAELRRPMKRAAVGEFATADGPQYAFRFDVLAAGASQPSFGIFCFDSGFAEPNRRVARPQLDWFAQQMRLDAEQGLRAPLLAMIHIPLIEFEKLRAAGAHQGNYGESVCYDNDSGDTFTAFRQAHRVKAVFSGHDHKNDYAGTWEGIELAYGRVGGWNAYGELPRGGRLIELDLAKQTYSHRLVLPDA